MVDNDHSEVSVSYFNLEPGDPAPWFKQRTPSIPEFYFSTAGGRYVVLCFFPSPTTAVGEAVLSLIGRRRDNFDDHNLQFYGVVLDPKDGAGNPLNNSIPGIRFFYDLDGQVSRMYGALPFKIPPDSKNIPFRPFCLVLDRMLRIIANIPFLPDGSDVHKLLPVLDSLPPLAHTAEPNLIPPVLILPDVFSPELCCHLISLYEKDGGYDSGFMSLEQGRTTGIIDYSHKRRRDYDIKDEALISTIKNTIKRRLVPKIASAFQFHVSHIERNIVACYSAEDGGHFNAHRDNIVPGTMHRRFAVTFNLNDDFDGGELSFPEFGTRSFRAPVGGAIVFSCSLMHAAGQVTRGKRYAYLPFLYDDVGSEILKAYLTERAALGISS